MVMEGTEDLMLNEFKAGSIHDFKFFEFWEKELMAPLWVLDTLRNGYEIPFFAEPGPYEEQNNASARNNMSIVRGILREMIAKEVLEVVDQKPVCVNPLGLVSKQEENGELKHRLVWDGSRHINTFLRPVHVRLAHLEKALEMTEPGDFQTVYDLSSAYYHIQIRLDQRRFLGASFLDENGKIIYVQYRVLPFGLASAVHAITKLFKPITSYLNTKGLRASIYIDDGRIVSSSREKAEQDRVFTYKVVTKAGWAIAKLKSDAAFQASQMKKYLGFWINSLSMKVFISQSKLQELEIDIKRIKAKQLISPKELASVLGKINASNSALGMLSRVATRSGYSLLAKHVQHMEWKGKLLLDSLTVRELDFFLENCKAHNGSLISSSLTDIRLETIIPDPKAKDLIIKSHQKSNTIFVSDASNFKAFVYELSNGSKTELSMVFSQSQAEQSSGARELMALLFTLRHWLEKGGPSEKSIYWATDSKNAVHFILKGSRRPSIQEMVFEICLLTTYLNLDIIPLHLLREDPRIELADLGSKTPDSDNWSIDSLSFSELNEKFDFSTDVFAAHDNAKLPRFLSLYYHPNALATDAFAVNWDSLGCMWLCPPISLLIKTHRKIIRTNCSGVICFPVWTTATFYNFFLDQQGNPKPPYKLVKLWHPYIIQNEGARGTALFGRVPFQFMACYFENLN